GLDAGLGLGLALGLGLGLGLALGPGLGVGPRLGARGSGLALGRLDDRDMVALLVATKIADQHQQRILALDPGQLRAILVLEVAVVAGVAEIKFGLGPTTLVELEVGPEVLLGDEARHASPDHVRSGQIAVPLGPPQMLAQG